MNRPLFLRLLLVDSLYGCALAAGALFLNRPVPAAALVAIVAVLLLYTAGAAVLAREAWRYPNVSLRRLEDVDWLSERLPGVAMLGSLAGFITEEQGTGGFRLVVLASTFVGIACWQALGLQHRMLSRETVS